MDLTKSKFTDLIGDHIEETLVKPVELYFRKMSPAHSIGDNGVRYDTYKKEVALTPVYSIDELDHKIFDKIKKHAYKVNATCYRDDIKSIVMYAVASFIGNFNNACKEELHNIILYHNSDKLGDTLEVSIWPEDKPYSIICRKMRYEPENVFYFIMKSHNTIKVYHMGDNYGVFIYPDGEEKQDKNRHIVKVTTN
jgi:hypothetical protein